MTVTHLSGSLRLARGLERRLYGVFRVSARSARNPADEYEPRKSKIEKNRSGLGSVDRHSEACGEERRPLSAVGGPSPGAANIICSHHAGGPKIRENAVQSHHVVENKESRSGSKPNSKTENRNSKLGSGGHSSEAGMWFIFYKISSAVTVTNPDSDSRLPLAVWRPWRADSRNETGMCLRMNEMQGSVLVTTPDSVMVAEARGSASLRVSDRSSVGG